MKVPVQSWFNTPERIARLDCEYPKWEHTPFRPNSCEPGRNGGVSCQMLTAALLRGAGAADLFAPLAKMNHARWNDWSVVDEAIRSTDLFVELPAITELVLPGDVLGFRIKKVVHHLAVQLSDGFANVIETRTVARNYLSDATWLQLFERIWRLKP